MLFGNRRLWLALAFVLVSFLTINFAIRGVQHGRRLRTKPDEPIQGWMNIGYVAHSYHVPAAVLHEALGLPPERDRRPLVQIAVDQGRSTDDVISVVEAAIKRFRFEGPPPPPRPPEPPAQGATP